jgi:aspartyl-tRNA(Asn)/glutamyl-tRNA(Gln) amidotransferase subunit B
MDDMDGIKIGLEVHIYPRTESKMFCRCSSSFLEALPNTNICPVCAGQPGAKPLPPNSSAVSAGIQIADVFGMNLSELPVVTMRKHYFYPDLPGNYQRTAGPMATGGALGKCRLREIHFEEDPGQYDLAKGTVDLNRSGVPLLELVTEPDMRFSSEAKRFLSDLLFTLEYLQIARDEMPFKVDTNISAGGGNRVEVKNINSVSGVVKALDFEAARQSELLSSGLTVQQETRHFDAINGSTVSLRYKETLEDYRYLPDPDVLPISLAGVKPERRESPFLMLNRMKSEGSSEADARTIIVDRHLLDAYNLIAAKCGARFSSVFIARDIKAEINYRKLHSSAIAQLSSGLLEIAVAYSSSRLSNRNATGLVRSLFDGGSIHPALEEMSEGWYGIDAVENIAMNVIADHQDAVEKYRKGNVEVINYFVGLCMKEMRGKAKSQDIIAALRRLMDQDSGASEQR